VIVEGFRVLPHLVKPILPALNHAVWLLPSPEFRQSTIERRGGSTSGFLAKTSNPERALQNLLERDRMFTDRLSKEVENLELRAIHVNTAMAEDGFCELRSEDIRALIGTPAVVNTTSSRRRTPEGPKCLDRLLQWADSQR
jgi:hypothetical protein